MQKIQELRDKAFEAKMRLRASMNRLVKAEMDTQYSRYVLKMAEFALLEAEESCAHNKEKTGKVEESEKARSILSKKQLAAIEETHIFF